MDNIDFELLRSDLLNYFGTAINFFPNATMDVIEVQNASYDELIRIAIENNFNLDNYKTESKGYK